MNILGGADMVLYNFNRNQDQLANTVKQLSSGLRVSSAADDPSGLAISQSLQARMNGLQQSVSNVQTANNVLTVADGAASTITQILQRINSLVIQSNSDMNSNDELQSIQAEINQLLAEVNRIASNANFNGLTLFDGSHDSFVQQANANVVAVEINPGPNPDGSTPTGDTLSNPQGPAGSTAKIIQNVQENSTQPMVPGLYIFQITGYSTNPNDPVVGPLGQPGVYIRQVLYSSSYSYDNGAGNESVFTNAVATGQGWDSGSGPGSTQIPSGTNSINFDYGNLSSNDVGAAIAYEIFTPQQSGGGTALNVNDGGQEGSVVSISLPSLSTSALQISDISVLRPTQVDDEVNLGAATGQDSSNQYAAMDAQARIQNALEQMSSLRATLGAQMVSLQEDATNDSTAVVNLTASMSSITDTNIAATVTSFTRQQILTQVGTSVLSQMQVHATELTSLLMQNL